MFMFLDSLGKQISVGDNIQWYSERKKCLRNGIVKRMVYKEVQEAYGYYLDKFDKNESNISARITVYTPAVKNDQGYIIKHHSTSVLTKFRLISTVI